MSGFRTQAKSRMLAATLCTYGLLGVSPVYAQEAVNPCGPLVGVHYGPYDYRTQRPRLNIVEIAHFTPVVEGLIRGETGDLGKDLAYTLRAAPNHHRALAAIARWSERTKSENLPGMEYTVSCWFERAMRFAPDDHIARSLFARWAGLRGQLDLARLQLEFVEQANLDNALTLYNVGQIYFELSIFDRAQALAMKAKELGFARPDLESALRSAGKWQEEAKP